MTFVKGPTDVPPMYQPEPIAARERFTKDAAHATDTGRPKDAPAGTEDFAELVKKAAGATADFLNGGNNMTLPKVRQEYWEPVRKAADQKLGQALEQVPDEHKGDRKAQKAALSTCGAQLRNHNDLSEASSDFLNSMIDRVLLSHMNTIDRKRNSGDA
jgi:hypothetical protein